MIIEDGDTLYPIEIKKHADPQKRDISAFHVLNNIAGKKRGAGGVICLYDKLITLNGDDKVIPIQYL